MTIVEAIKAVMHQAARPLSSREAFDAIVAQGLYQFQAKDPQHVVLMQIRRHCMGIDFPTASPTKHFQLHGDSTYTPLDQPTRSSISATNRQIKKKGRSKQILTVVMEDKKDFGRLSSIERNLWDVHKRYLSNFKLSMLHELKK